MSKTDTGGDAVARELRHLRVAFLRSRAREQSLRRRVTGLLREVARLQAAPEKSRRK